MDSGYKIYRFVYDLAILTKHDRLDWVESFFGHTCKHKDVEVFVSWMSGDRPSITIGGSVIEGLCFGIQELVQAIDAHYKRKKKGRYSKKNAAALKKAEKECRQEEKERLDRAVSAIEEIDKKK